MKYRYIRALTALIIFGCCVAALLTLHGHAIFYQEQHRLFLFTADYFTSTVKSGGFLQWLGDFFIQFYYYPLLGASIVGAILAGVYLLVESIIRVVTGRRDFLQLGVIAAGGLYFTLCGLEQSLAVAFCVLVGLAIVRLVLLCFKRWLPKPKGAEPVAVKIALLIVALAVAYIYCGYWLIVKDYNRAERAMLRTEKAIKNHDWDRAIALSDQYLSTGHSNKLILYFRSIALAHKGQLLEHLFDFPQNFGQQALAFPWSGDSREAEYGHLVHEITGDINAAHHWAFEAMTVWGETAPHLLDLTRYNMALGRPAVARKFARRLSHSLFYHGEANRLLKEIDAGSRGDLRYALADKKPANISWINVKDFSPNLMQNYLADPQNKITRQYLLASMLLNNYLRTLIPMLTYDDLQIENIREAVLLYSLDPQATPLSTYGIEVNDATGKRFAPFFQNMHAGRRELQQAEYGKTFWYYVHYLYKRK